MSSLGSCLRSARLTSQARVRPGGGFCRRPLPRLASSRLLVPGTARRTILFPATPQARGLSACDSRRAAWQRVGPPASGPTGREVLGRPCWVCRPGLQECLHGVFLPRPVPSRGPGGRSSLEPVEWPFSRHLTCRSPRGRCGSHGSFSWGVKSGSDLPGQRCRTGSRAALKQRGRLLAGCRCESSEKTLAPQSLSSVPSEGEGRDQS